MSNGVEKRVVGLGFENAQFESGVKASLKTIEDLKKGLNLDNAAKSVSSLSAATKGFSVTGMSDGLLGLSNRFSTLGIIGMTVIQNLTNSILNMGKQLVAAVTIDPLKQGFQEYELKLGSIQTIMAGTGESLDTVNRYLNDLNTYSDRTIYSFADMTTNIGKFTNAGVSLKKSVAAIQGVANAAALSGSNANEASRAMYNFAQALSAGYVKLIDWKSIENANMATVAFKTQLLETAVAMGTLTKTTDGFYKTAKGTLITATKGFNEALEQQWLTSEVLTDTLGKYADETTDIGKAAFAAAQDVKTFSQMIDTLKEALGSGWAQTWELVIGNFDEAKSLFTEINDILSGLIGASAESRNNLLAGWKELGGRSALIAALRQAFQGVLNIVDALGDVLSTLFPPITASQLYNFTVLLLNAAIAFKDATEKGDNLKRIFMGIASVLQIGFQIIEAVVGGLLRLTGVITGPLVGGLDLSVNGILGFLAGIGDWLVALKDMLREQDFFNKAVNKIGEVLGIAAYNVQYFAGVVQTSFVWAMGKLTEYIERAKVELKAFTDVAGPWLTQAMADANVALEPLTKAFRELGEKLGPVLKTAMEELSKQFEKVDPGKLAEGFVSFGDRVKTAMAPLKGVFEAIGGVFSWFGRILEKLAPGIKIAGEWLVGAFKTIGEKIENFVDNIDFEKVGEILKNGLLAALVLAITNFFKQGGDAIGGVADILDGVKDSLEAWQNSLKSKTLLEIAAALGILTISILALSTIDDKKLSTALSAMTIMFAELVASMKVLDAAKGGGLKTASLQLIVLAVGLLLFSKAVNTLAKIDADSFTQGLIGVGVLLGELAIFMKLAGKTKGVPQGASLIAFAVGLMVLSKAVEVFGKLKPEEMEQGLKAMGAVLLEIAIFSELVQNSNILQSSASMVIMSGALIILSLAIKALGNLSWPEIARGLTAMGGSLALISLALKNLDIKTALSGSVAITIVSASLLVLAAALKALGNLSLDELQNGFIAMAGALTIMAVTLKYMEKALPGALAIAVLAGALTLLVPILFALGSMPLATIAIGLGALAGIFVVLGVAGWALQTLAPVFMALGAAITVFSIAMLIGGQAMVLFGTGLALVAINGVAAAGVLILVVSKMLEIIEPLSKGIVDAIVRIAVGIAQAAPTLAAAAIVTVGAIVHGILASLATIAAAAGEIITMLLTVLLSKSGEIIAAGFTILVQLLTGIRDNIPLVVPLVFEIIGALLLAIGEQLVKIGAAGLELIKTLFESIGNGINTFIPTLLTQVGKIATNIIDGIVGGLKAGVQKVIDAAANLGREALAAIGIQIEAKSPSKAFARYGMWSAEGYAGGIEDTTDSAVKAAKDMGKRTMNSLSKAISNLGEVIGSDIDLQPTIRPVLDLTDVVAGGKDISKFLSGGSISVSGSSDKLSSITSGMKIGQDTNQTVNADTKPSSVSFTQYNYSPTALSRFEIYRQTRNQLKMMKGLVPNT